MKVTVIQNSAYGPAGLVEKYISAKGWTCRQVLSPKDVVTTDLAHIVDDVVIFLGSRRGVYETHVQWIARQRALMRRLMANSVPVFGICFGAQLMATALGGTVAPMGHRYRGWMVNDHAVNSIWEGPWLRWHGDSITLPEGVEIFASDQNTIQAFRQGSAVGVQFHPEISSDLLHQWAAYRTSMTGPDKFALQEATVYAESHARQIERRAFELIDEVFGMMIN
ncbi:type 1 glutamine amidotransferase [Hyphomicrobium sp. 99]|uniref:type 1 glutamine amidotransferase n=1 Tax=Hyphomicrobium sp. 99 TaxID=1163419 RepID=UPI0005F765F8|nr:type 1 glutamine amidotransferase [Hyphomicrobium sp. 99]